MADKVFVNDDILVTLNTNKVLTAFATLKIKFKNPFGIEGNWPAVIHPSLNTRMQATVNFNTAGIWQIQAFAASPGEKYHGMWVDVKVYQPIAPDTTVLPTTMVPTT